MSVAEEGIKPQKESKHQFEKITATVWSEDVWSKVITDDYTITEETEGEKLSNSNDDDFKNN